MTQPLKDKSSKSIMLIQILIALSFPQEQVDKEEVIRFNTIIMCAEGDLHLALHAIMSQER